MLAMFTESPALLVIGSGESAVTITGASIEREFTNLSHFPERRARMELGALASRLNRFEEFARQLGDDAPGFDWGAEVARFAVRHVALTRTYWAREGRTASAFIVGPARFPTARNEKRMRASDNARALIPEHEQRARRSAERRAFPHGRPDGPIRSDNPDALALLRDRIAELEAKHAAMIAANKAKRGTFQSYSLTNNRANLQRLKDRLRVLEHTQARGQIETDAGAFRIVENPDAARVQLIFPGKPDDKTRALLKASGFRWAPSEGAWQRHLNDAGRSAARRVQTQLATEQA